MIRHVFITFLRDLNKNRVSGFINLLGLALALGSSFLILLYILHETSYNKFHTEKDRICRVLTESSWMLNVWELSSSSSLLLADVLQNEYPEVEKATRVCDYELFYGGQLVKKDEEYIHEINFKVVDPSFFKIFSIPIIRGDINTFLKDPYDVVISESTAGKYFGSENPVGKTLSIRNYDGEKEFIVVGVYKDLPSSSTFKADLIGNLELTLDFYGERGWGMSNIQTYVLLKDEQSIPVLEEKLKDFYKEKHPDREAYYHLQPLKEIHFHSDHLSWYQLPQGNLKRVYLLAAIAFLILIIPCINYIILTTGKGMNRYIEIGIKKVVGATKRSVFFQVTVESVLFLTLALPFAVMVSELMLPTFSRLINIPLEIEYFRNWKYLCGLFFITLLFGTLSGVYISLSLSRFQPEDILKLRFTSRYGNKIFRRILIVMQLTIFLVLFIFTGIQYKQLKFIEKNGVGFDPGNVLAVVPPHEHDLYSCKAYVDAIENTPGVESVTEVYAGLFTAVVWYINFLQENNPDEGVNFRGLAADASFIQTFGLNILEGRDFFIRSGHRFGEGADQ